jgi:hypothetical protein
LYLNDDIELETQGSQSVQVNVTCCFI